MLNEENGIVYSAQIDNLEKSLKRVLSATGLSQKLQSEPLVIIKPNLVEAVCPPVTTPVELVDALIGYLQNSGVDCEIIVGEGTGSASYDTFHCFEVLGYTKMAEKRGVQLLDLNKQSLIKKENDAYIRLPELYLPEILDGGFLLSVPVLKAHSLAGVTLTMKNMMGYAPPAHYRQGSSWGKSKFHHKIQEAIFDLNRYRAPDFTLLDASIGMSESHLWGATCDPPVNRLAAGWDPVAIDSYGTSLLNRNWQDIGHIQLSHGTLGVASPLQIIEC